MPLFEIKLFTTMSDRQFTELKQEIKKMSEALDRLEAQVTAIENRGDATIALLNGIADQLKEHLANNNTQKIAELADRLAAQAQDFNTAIERNTTPVPPVEPPVVEPPVEEPTPEVSTEEPTE